MTQEADSPPENEDQGLLVSHNNSGTDKNSIGAKFKDCVETLKKESENLFLTTLKHVDECVKSDLVTRNHNNQLPQLHRDDNLVLDSLPSGNINDLGKSIKLKVAARLEEECLDVYRTCRRGLRKDIRSLFKKLSK
ncbi:unnamed protein product [Sphenostylis stenocarpa]|uniref:Uncharacterized protein n=1 Tax=Sphenostylis stenocarpa TaxID=92480 RepID=A0AA86T7F8_9FABA|nr:unnamed protein product [Sphenostylis stenocarpa]